MPRCCSVAGCKSNYKSQNEAVSTFSLPKNTELREIWLRKIPTDLTAVKKPVICAKHFSEDSIITTEKFVVDGQLKIFDRTYPKLKPDAVPSIFPNLPSYLSSDGSSCRRLCDAEQENLEKAITDSLKTQKQFEEQNALNSLKEVKEFFSVVKETFKGQWCCVDSDEKVVLCLMDIGDSIPIVLGAVCITIDLSVKLSVNNHNIPQKMVPKKYHNIKTKIVFQEVMEYVESQVSSEELTRVLVVERVTEMLQGHFCNKECSQLNFLIEQINLLNVKENCRRYGANSLLLAASVYIHSPAAYTALRKIGYLYLPHPSNLQKLIGKFSMNKCNIDGSTEYLKVKKQFLKEHEHIVNILLDEIYIYSRLTFKGDTIYGVSKTESPGMAKTAQVFMISSIFSKYRDVVSIIPVDTLKADDLKSMLLHVIKEVENLGFTVLSVVADNNAVNRKCYELLTSACILQPCIEHPVNNGRKLFLIFDTVHILKCIRNNWITKHDGVLKFPDFNNFELIVTADFKYLELMYKVERDSLLKFGHLLSYRVLYPSNTQKQNVNLALRIFDERNLAALKCLASRDARFTGIEHTVSFMKIICIWWNIVNVKGPFEGERFNNTYRNPIRENSFVQIDFLTRMCHWLRIWRQSVPQSQALSSQTFQSLINTLEAFLLMIPYVFMNHKTDYILLSKFQNDSLEGRFSIYRQLSGANYYISYVQVLESERKLRFKDMLLLHFNNKDVPLKTLLPCSNEFEHSVDIEKYSAVLLCSFEICEISHNVLPILMYVAGYAVKKELFQKECVICKSWLQSNKEIEVSVPNDFILEYDHGKLTIPTEKSVKVAGLAWFMLQRILETYADSFLGNTHQLSILFKICCIKIEEFEFITCNIEEQCKCKRTLRDVLQKINFRSCKVMLNNLTKEYNDSTETKICGRKLKKLKSI